MPAAIETMSCSAIPFSTSGPARPARRAHAAVRREVGVEDDEPRLAGGQLEERFAVRAATYSLVTGRAAGAPAPLSGSPWRLVAPSGPSGPRAPRRPAQARARRALLDPRSTSAAAAPKVASSGAPACHRYVPPPSASATGCSMNETPLPLIVRAMSTPGVPLSRSRACRSDPERPVVVTVAGHDARPNARSFASRLSSATISSVALSDWSSFRSTTTSSRPTAGARPPGAPPSSGLPGVSVARHHDDAAASAEWRFAQAMPRAFEIPIPSDPCSPRSPARRRRGARRARRAAGAAAAARRDHADRVERCVEARHVVTLGREEDVAIRRVEPDVEDVQLLPEQVRDEVERAERRADMPRPARLTAVSALNRHMSARSARRRPDRGLRPWRRVELAGRDQREPRHGGDCRGGFPGVALRDASRTTLAARGASRPTIAATIHTGTNGSSNSLCGAWESAWTSSTTAATPRRRGSAPLPAAAGRESERCNRNPEDLSRPPVARRSSLARQRRVRVPRRRAACSSRGSWRRARVRSASDRPERGDRILADAPLEVVRRAPDEAVPHRLHVPARP